MKKYFRIIIILGVLWLSYLLAMVNDLFGITGLQTMPSSPFWQIFFVIAVKYVLIVATILVAIMAATYPLRHPKG